jgi:predicted  nucleic acid-binding Zn-ribbon protein
MRMDVESEIRDLKRRVGEIEGTYGFLSGQVREVHRAVLGFQEQSNERFDTLEGRMDGIDGRMDRFDQQLDALPRALAEIVRAEFERRDHGESEA